ncbi:MAG: phage major capsid protein, partial [Actinomycetota bacterium]
EFGLKLKEWGSNNQENQLVEVRRHQALEFATMFRVPPHKIGIMDRATFSNIEHQAIEYVTEARIKTLDGRIRTAERQQSLRAATAIPAPSAGTPADPEDPEDVRVRVHAEPRERPEPGIRFAQITRALIVGRGNPESAAAFAMQTWGERHEITAALQQNDFESGGALVPERFTAELIDLLEPRTVIRRNTMTVPLIGGTDNMPTIEEGIFQPHSSRGDLKLCRFADANRDQGIARATSDRNDLIRQLNRFRSQHKVDVEHL